MFSLISVGLALLPFAAAQTVHDVQVGGANGALAFDPEAIFAQPGDQVVFHFHPKNHSVTQTSFADPCGAKAGGFNSGFMPVSPNTTDNLPTYTITVKDTSPIWINCQQAANTANSHCGKGMVFAVNCGSDGQPNSFTNFKNSALAIGAKLSGQSPSSTYSYGAGSAPSQTYTAAYGGVTVPPPAAQSLVTQTITLDASTWTTSYTSYAGSPNPTPASLSGVVHKVIVGGPGKLAFDPPHVAAQPRDIIMFEFHQKNHTVTQSSFADPCRKLSANGVPSGFDSGFMPVDSNATSFPTWNLTVNDTAPIWAYCRQANHCGAGMVFAVNSDESSARNFSAFQGLAMTLNGTSATASGSGAAPSATSGAGSMARFSAAFMTVMLGAILATIA